jgi:hypothetical protein
VGNIDDHHVMSLLELPQELRDKVYAYTLVSSDVIVAWSGERHSLEVDNAGYDTVINKRRIKNSVRHLATNLLFCGNKAVHYEAASIFYRRNVFKFEGEHDHQHILSWLTVIGAYNRSFLSKLEVVEPTCQYVWQLEDGSRSTPEGLRSVIRPQLPIYPRFPQLLLPSSIAAGYVCNINPALEAIFAIFKNCPKITLLFQVDEYIPGIALDPPINFPDYISLDRFTMDRPNLIEIFREKNTQPHGNIQIQWLIKDVQKAQFDSKRREIAGYWDIIEEAKVRDWEYGVLILKRKPLIRPIMAADPLPPEWWEYLE